MHMGHLWLYSIACHFGFIQCTSLKMACNLKMTGRRVKLGEIWDSGVVAICIWSTFDLSVLIPVTQKQLAVEWNGLTFGNLGTTCSMYMGHICPFSVQGHFGVIRCTCLKLDCTSDTPGRTEKLVNLGPRCSCSGSDLLLFKATLGSFGALGSKWPVTWKRLTIEQKGVKFRTRRAVLICIRGPFDLLVFNVILGSLSAIVSK